MVEFLFTNIEQKLTHDYKLTNPYRHLDLKLFIFQYIVFNLQE